MPARLETGWSYKGYRALVLENELVRVVLFPELGAKIWELTYKPADRQWLWHNPRVELRAAPFGSVYDDHFCGGWDELFPNDMAEVVDGEALVDHGEVWSLPWTVQVEAAGPHEVTVCVTRATPITPARLEKRITLRSGEAKVRLHQQITHTGYAPFAFMWKLHPALAIEPGYRIDIPARRAEADPDFSGRAGGAGRFDWPGPAGVDLRQVPGPERRLVELVYGTELTAGWCALTDPVSRLGFGLAFPPDVFRSVWVFGAYGGWRGLYTAILEPCTGYPYRLGEAVARGQAARLAPGETLSAAVTAVCYAGPDAVRHITSDGEVS